jgi:hypothetical protein
MHEFFAQEIGRQRYRELLNERRGINTREWRLERSWLKLFRQLAMLVLTMLGR